MTKAWAWAARAAVLHVLEGGVEPAVTDEILGNGPAEQHRVLQHDRDALAQPAAILRHVDAVDEHAALLGLVEPRNQAGQRGLAGAGQTDERDHLARPRDEADVVQNRSSFVVGEAHVLEPDLAGDPRGVDRIGPIERLRHEGEDFAYARALTTALCSFPVVWAIDERGP